MKETTASSGPQFIWLTRLLHQHLRSGAGHLGRLEETNEHKFGTIRWQLAAVPRAKHMLEGPTQYLTVGYRLVLRHCSIQQHILSTLSSMSSGVLLGNSNTMPLS